MTEVELYEYLKENLSLSLDTDPYSNRVKITLRLTVPEGLSEQEGCYTKTISEDSFYLPEVDQPEKSGYEYERW
jgi:hypothetical protein